MNRIHLFAGDLREGDVLRDSGMNRTILKLERIGDVAAEVLVHFEAYPDAEPTLSMAAATPVTAWRAT